VLKLREAVEKHAIKEGVIPEELLAAFKRDIQERRKELEKLLSQQRDYERLGAMSQLAGSNPRQPLS
jgi:hypothetical protein